MSGEYDPGSQSTQLDAPVEVWYWPAVQTEHVVWPVRLKVPAAHDMQPDAPVEGWYVPAAQEVHELAALAE